MMIEKLNWSVAPRKTEYGDGMMVATIGLDADSTATIACHADDIGKVDKAVEQLQRKNDALVARVADLEQALNYCTVDITSWASYASEHFKEKNDFNGDIEKHQTVLDRTESESLAHIQAAAVEKFKQHIISQMDEDLSGDEGCDLIVPIYEFEFFKSQLRQQGGE